MHASGTRFQAARNQNEKEDVDPEYEDETDCFRYHRCDCDDHLFVYMPSLQVLNCDSLSTKTTMPSSVELRLVQHKDGGASKSLLESSNVL